MCYAAHDVRAALQATNANRPKGAIEGNGQRLQIYSGGSVASGGLKAADYQGLVVAWRNGAAIRLQDVAEVADGVENTNTIGLFNGQPAVIVVEHQSDLSEDIDTLHLIGEHSVPALLRARGLTVQRLY